MASHTIHARRPRGEWPAPAVVRDTDVVASFLEDAAHFPGGHAIGVADADVGGGDRRAAGVGRDGPAGRRAVVADRRRHASRRRRTEHLAAQPDPRDRPGLDPRASPA